MTGMTPGQLRLTVVKAILADAFLGMAFGVRPARPDQPPLTAEQIVDLFLHGAV